MVTVTRSRRALVVQHVAVEGPARIADALAAAGVEVEVLRIDLGEQVPDHVADLDALVVMGGPMSARRDDAFPTRRSELALLRQAVGHRLPVLGVCLGAQLLAAAAGGVVRSGSGLEIGWRPIELLAASSTDELFADLDGPLEVLHWHGETYDLPPGAVRLASSAAYVEQAFRIGSSAWGLQFHLEVDPREVDCFVEAFPDDAASADGGAAGIRRRSGAALTRLGPARDALLGRFAALVARR